MSPPEVLYDYHVSAQPDGGVRLSIFIAGIGVYLLISAAVNYFTVGKLKMFLPESIVPPKH